MPPNLCGTSPQMGKGSETKSIHAIFELQVSRTPNAPAIYFPKSTNSTTNDFWTYQELNEKSNKLAHKILQNNQRNRSTYSDQPLIAILLSNCQDFLAAIFAVLKSGGVFIPLSMEYPLKHLQRILKDAGNPLLITTKNMLTKFDALSSAVVLMDDEILRYENNTQNPGLNMSPNDLAYIIYTSGSTGTPKGVMIEHQSVVNLALWQISFFSLNSSDKSSLFSNPAFDASIVETFPCLFIGGSLHVIPKDTRLDPEAILRWLHFNKITITDLPAIVGHDVINVFREQRFTELGNISLRYLTIGGDKALEAYTDNFPFQVINSYGPTEATVQATIFPFSEYNSSKMTAAPIGKPISNVEVYIWNRDTKEPLGELQIGEIWIGGSGVARGYYNNQKLTEEKFIKNPFNNNPNSRIYQTGDLGCWLPDGNLEFIGRVDNQVKIRGFRVQLDEIEFFLNELQDIQNAVVVYDTVERSSPSEKQLFAFIVLHEFMQDKEHVNIISLLKDYCIDNLPPYMIPQHWTIVKEIPLTPSGKADRKSLLASANVRIIEIKIETYHPSIKTDLEKKIADIWATVLHLPINSIRLSDNFFQLGGHSLLVVQIINRVRNIFTLELVELSSLFKYPNFRDFVSHLQNIEKSRVSNPVAKLASGNVVERNVETIFPLSYAQQLIWLHIEKTGLIEMYNDFIWINMSSVNDAALEFCINAIFEKHEALRTTILIENGDPYQKFAGHFWQPLQVVEFLQKNKTLEEREALAKEWSAFESRKPFNLSKGPLAKFVLLRLDDNVNKLCIIAHHLVMDGVSLAQVILPELCTLYQIQLNGSATNSSNSNPNVNYGDYVLRQQKEYENLSPQALSSISFWKNILADLTPLTLPYDRVKKSTSSSNGKVLNFSIPPHIVNEIYLLCQEYQTTVYITLLTVIKILLHRCTGQEDICICGITAGRDELETEQFIGHFTNLVAFRDKIDGRSNFVDVLKKVTKSAAEVYENQNIPFLKIISESNLNYPNLIQALSSVVFSMELDPPENDLGWTINQLDIDTSVARFDLTIRVEKKPDLMNVLFEYNSDIFDESTIQRLSTHFLTLIESVIKYPENLLIDTLDILPISEKETVLGWSCRKAIMDYPKTKTIYELFEEQVDKTPKAISVQDYNGNFVTYQELYNKASSLASVLHSKYNISPGKETFVVILLPQSIDFVVACLAVLKSGVAFIPLSEDFPLQRIQFVLDDSKCQLLISNSKILQKLGINSQENQREKISANILDLTDSLNYNEVECTPKWNFSSSKAAYAIYTSGSTGQPKGVIISHKSVINISMWHVNENNLSSKDRSALMATPAFDIFIFEMFPYLFCGASLHIASPEVKKVPKSLLHWFQDNQITMAFLTPALAEPFVKQNFTSVEKYFSLKKLYTGGDSITFYPDESLPFDLVNLYGPTETTIAATEINLKMCNKSYPIPPIGKPINNYQVFILDNNMKPVPIGITGEIYIAGDGLAKGYLNRPDLTAEKFIRRSINGKWLRLYKTGDLGNWLSDGNIRFVGRIDEQVKIRGFRIELGEIQSLLDEHPSVQQSVVLVRNNGNDREIVCYIQPSENKNETELKIEDVEMAASKHVESFQTLFEEVYRPLDSTMADEQASTIGWHSTFTGSEIPQAEMKEWVKATVAQIMTLKPKKVLEIGCGSGLILERIAPFVESYVATDFSSVAINALQKRLKHFQTGILLKNTKFIIRPGDVLSKDEFQAYDTIIINSVVQYFPDLSYLTKVLEGAVNATKSGGHIFVGDVRDLKLFEAFHGAVQRYKASPTTTIGQWKNATEKAMESEGELVIHPKFFTYLAKSHERLSHATTNIKRGNANNEMNCFRYDAVLHLHSNDSILPLDNMDRKQFQSFETLMNDLQNFGNEEGDVFAVKEIPNSRVYDDLQTLKLTVINSDEHLELSRQNHLQGLSASKVNPEEVAIAAESFGFQVHLTLADNPAYFDAIFFKDLSKSCSYYQNTPHNFPDSYSNQPLKQKMEQMTLQTLKSHLKSKLPSYMIPVSWFFVDSIPTTVNGKIDKRKLSQQHCSQIRSDEKFVPPKNMMENELCDIWSRILKYPAHRISTADNFFEIGGNSLLAVQLLESIRQKYETQIPLQLLFEASDIQQLSKLIEKHDTQNKNNEENNSSLILMKSASNKDPKGNPIFLIHPVGGTVFCYQPLAKYLDSNRDIYAIQDQSILTREILYASVEEMAAGYINIIRQCHPNGPIVIGGHSFGGLVAFEIAKQLGPNEVEMVILIDSSPINNDHEFEINDKERSQNYLIRCHEEIQRQKYEQINLPDLQTWLELGSHRYKMALSYSPPLIDSKLILFTAEEEIDEMFPWQTCCKVPVTEFTVSGDHDAMLLEPNVKTLAMKLHLFL